MIRSLLSGITLLVSASSAFAQSTPPSPFTLDGTARCGADPVTAIGIAVGDVTFGGVNAIDCWGTFEGNAPTQKDAKIEIVGEPAPFVGIYDYESKIEQGEGGVGTVKVEGSDVGLSVSGPNDENDPFERRSGKWSFDGFGGHDFLITLKAGPRWAAWLFSGAAAGPYSGTWSVAWKNNLSNFAVFKGGPSVVEPPTGTVPVPPSFALLALGLVALLGGKKRRH